MSEEFTRIATQEILEELSEILKILDTCKNDNDMVQNVDDFEKHFHKIKGLAPMMKKEQVGNLASLFDSLMKQIQNGHKLSGVYAVMAESISKMKTAMNEDNENLEDLQSTLYAKFSI